ncbi:MAG: hypothetical protein IH851_02800 [Armatimonadetes bacterium]|nr:hypothetical protein [Armatimonadota bacterium]
MNKSLRIGLAIVVAIVVGSIVWHLIGPLLMFGIKLAFVAAIALIIYGLFTRKSLGGGRKRWLP